MTVGNPTPRSKVVVTVETSSWINRFTVQHGTPVVVNLPSELQLTGSDHSNRHKAVHIYTRSLHPIFVLAENFVRFSHLAFQAYPHRPIEGLFLYEYIITSAKDLTQNFRSQFLLVGCEDNTVVYIVPSQNVSVPEDLQLPNSPTTKLEAGIPSKEFVLNQMQTLLVLNMDDLSGSRIVSNKPITVISGHECTNDITSNSYNAYYSLCSCEPLSVQIPPTEVWGTRFMFTTTTKSNYLQTKGAKVTVFDRNTYFSCGYNSGYVYNQRLWSLNGHIYTYDTSCDYVYAEFNEPTYNLMSFYNNYHHYYHDTAHADQAYSAISPIEQYLNEIDFISLPTNKFLSTMIIIFVQAEHFNTSNILLDGSSVDCSWLPIYNYSSDRNHKIVGYSCSKNVSSHISSPFQHKVAHSDPDGLLSVTVLGFNLSPPRSYAYLPGQVFKTGKLKLIIVSR